MKRFLIGYALLTTCLLFMQQKPLLVYHEFIIGNMKITKNEKKSEKEKKKIKKKI